MKFATPLLLGSLFWLAVIFGSSGLATAQSGDASLFSASGGAPPNIMILLDSSGSMGGSPENCDGCEIKRIMANRAILSLVTAVNPPDGSGGYINNARLGLAIFTKAGANLLVPIADDTVGQIVSLVSEPSVPEAADFIKSIGGNSHGLAMMEMGRYFAHPGTWAGFPPWGFASDLYTGPAYTGTADPADFPEEDPTLPPVWDLACRPSFLIHIDDGLWGGNDGGRFGDCGGDTCALTNIGDLSGDGEFWMEDISQAMFENDFSDADDGGFAGLQNVVTYVIGFDEPEAVDLMQIAAERGGGSFFFATNELELEQALFAITVNIFESVASFAGVAVPSSRSSSDASLYNAYFEPRNDKSIWAGHLESYGLSGDGTIVDSGTPAGSGIDPQPATDADGLLVDPHNPYWDAGPLLAANTDRTIYTTTGSGREVLSTSTVTTYDLTVEVEEGTEPEPEPEEDDSCVAVPAVVPTGWDFQLTEPDTLPDVLPDGTVTFRYCVAPTRSVIAEDGTPEIVDANGIDRDAFGTFLVPETHTDGIEIKNRKKADAICTYDADGTVSGGHKSELLQVGKTEGLAHVRYFTSIKKKDKKGNLQDAENFTDAGLAGYSASVCVAFDAGGAGSPAPQANPDFAPYPNSSVSGIDTYEELHAAVIDFTYGKDAFAVDPNERDDNREVVLGDIFHSTPIVIGQPPTALLREDGFPEFKEIYDSRDRVIYVGANDGMLHAFHAGDFQPEDPDTGEPGYYDPGTGEELFGYVPGLLLDKLKYLSHNIPRSVYFMDAPPAAADVWFDLNDDYIKTVDEWGTVMVAGMREGGPGYLALDVTDPGAVTSLDPGEPGATVPGLSCPTDVTRCNHAEYPKLLWEFTHPNMGGAWSEPVITRVKVQGASGVTNHCGYTEDPGTNCTERWVAIFAGGYTEEADPNHFSYEGDPDAAGWTDRSKAIFMVDLETGALLASVEFDANGVTGPAEMKYAIPSSPAALDHDFDGFTDVVYVGDTGGQMWKWDISEPGQDTAGADGIIDNWSAGIFFDAETYVLANGDTHYRSIYFPPAAAFVDGRLTLAFGTGEREELRFETTENRFFVIRDEIPVGSGAFPGALTVSDISSSNVTDLTEPAGDPTASDPGFYYDAEAGEKFVTDVSIFAGYVIVATYTPVSGADLCTTSGGQAFIHVFGVDSGIGIFPDSDTPADATEDRRLLLGGGLPSSPTVSLAPDSHDDTIIIKTSTGQIITVDPPPRPDDPVSAIYWRQRF